ncbi:hypothetical protein CKA32_003523 [Geitlerinema sp. FC II]|nr:hypothetical protein CKA32_003523 [Geitlerinema sp. FC II]
MKAHREAQLEFSTIFIQTTNVFKGEILKKTEAIAPIPDSL